ncbi:hypothetical protein Q8A73_001562 [Channa argus]|nr:hypothetical protein Q8A73_001562 [Channa argus]
MSSSIPLTGGDMSEANNNAELSVAELLLRASGPGAGVTKEGSRMKISLTHAPLNPSHHQGGVGVIICLTVIWPPTLVITAALRFKEQCDWIVRFHSASGSMPAVFILLRSLVIRLLSSRLAGSVAQFLRRSLSTGIAHLGTALRHVWDCVRSQESKEAILGCVLCILNMHKKVEN